MSAVTYHKRTLRSIQPAGKRVLMRVDFNVPLRDGEVADDSRIVAALPSIRYLLQAGARVILMSHLGRPKGQVQPQYSLRPIATRLNRLLRQPVAFVDDCVGTEAGERARALEDGEVLLLENLRFHAAEETNDPAFAEKLAALGELYVNDAFGTAHRAHASTEGVTRYLTPAVAGFLMEKELQYLGRLLEDPKRPFVAVLGGAKISGKIDVLRELMGKVDRLLVGGAMMFTFNRARGLETGASLVEEDRIDMAREILNEAKRRGVELLLPGDCIVSATTDGSDASRVAAVDALGPADIGVDVGPETIVRFREALRGAKTVFWNGPMGIFEVPAFARGTLGVAEAIAAVGAKGAVTVVGGGDSVLAVHQAGLTDQFSHLSTGGGASLEFLEGKTLPGVAALEEES
jgi:phosphoglycerate kinase